MFARFIFGLLLVTSGLPAARALPAAAQVLGALHAIDTTRNNAINRAEWQEASFALFRAADKNDDNFIDAVELKASTFSQDTFSRLDTDRDGRLGIDEFMILRREIFTTADYNRDDYVTLVEFELLMVYEAVGWQDPNEPGLLPVAQLKIVLTKLFALLDADKDGHLGKEEAAYMQPQHFQRFDQDKDGTLSQEELIMGYRREFEA
jgi:hypothetical protein